MKRLIPLVAAVGAMWFSARAQQGPQKAQLLDQAKHDLAVDFDARRDSAGPAALVAQRKAAVETFVAAGSDLRITLDDHGLPKSVLRERSALGPPSRQGPVRIAKDFLLEHRAIFPFTAAEVENLRLASQDDSAGVFTVVDFHQTLNGIPVFQGLVKVTVDRAGQVVQAGVGGVIPQLVAGTTPRLSAEEAVREAYRSLHHDPPAGFVRASGAFRNPRGSDYTDITAELSLFPMAADAARLAYRILLELDESHWFEMLVDADDGRLLFRHNLYVSAAQGRVWRESPQKGERQLLPFPEPWMPPSTTVTTGNNVDAFLDRNGDNTPDATTVPNTQNGRAFSAAQIFDFPAAEGTTGQDPRNFGAGSVTNLFYLVNTAHDYFYGLGFNEAAGNFQTNNFGRGGAGNDAVRAQAQFGGFTNNASFAPSPDGVPPRLRMGLFTRGTPQLTDDLDSSYDGQVVLHEYGHGVSTRLVGARTDVSCLSGLQSAAISEGWSDYFSCSFYNDPVQGAYLTQDRTRGIRRQSYEGYTFTYEDFGNEGFESHRDGEIWTATLWDLRKTLGQSAADRLVFNGLKLTPCRPSMIDARDAILAADQAAGGANRARLWQVFARHGMGFSARGIESGNTGGLVYDAAFDQPTDLQPGNRNPRVTSRPPRTAMLGALYNYGVQAEDPDGGQLRFELAEGPAGMTIAPTTGVLTWTPTFTGVRVKVVITDGQGGRAVHGFFVRVETPLNPGIPITIAGPRGSTGLAVIDVPVEAPVLQVTLRGGAGDADLALFDPEGILYGLSLRLQSNETLSVSAPQAGRWTIRVLEFGSSDYSGVALTAALPVPALLPANSSQPGKSAEAGSETFYRISLPAGVSLLRVATSGGSGDADIYVRRGQVPVCQLSDLVLAPCIFDQRSTGSSTTETLDVTAPASGDWYIDLAGYNSYAGVTLTTSILGAPALLLSSPALVFAAVQGDASPAPQNLIISNAARAHFTWTAEARASAGGSWLRIAPTSGQLESTVAVSVNPAGLAVGIYDGSITVTALELGGSPQTVPVKLSVTARPVIALPTTNISFATLQGQDPAPQALNVSVSGGLSFTAVPRTVSGGNWLVVTPAGGAGSANVMVSARAAALPEGNYTGAITIAAPGAANSPAVIRVSLSVGLPVELSSGGIVNAGSFLPNRPVAPNEILSLFGRNFTGPCSLAPGSSNICPAAQGFPLPTELASTRVTFNGTPAPLLVATPEQINLVVPFGVAGPTATLVVTRGSLSSAPVTVPVADQSIGILTALSTGTGAGIILHTDGRLVSREAPIDADEVLVMYATGLGRVTPPIASGSAAPASPLSDVATVAQVLFDDQQGRVSFAGAAPGYAGLYQLNMTAPSALARRFPLVRLRGAASVSNEVSAGGPSILDITPRSARSGADVEVAIRGINFAPGSALRAGEEMIPATLADGPLQTLTATLPGRLLTAGSLSIVVVDPAAPEEAPSNSVQLAITTAP